MPSRFLIKNLDEQLSINKLEALHLEICAGISQSQTNMSSRVIPHYEMAKEFDKLYEFKTNEGARISAVANEGSEFLSSEIEKDYYNRLNHEQKKRFLQLYKNAYWDGEFVRLKFTRSEFLQHPFATFHESMCEWHPNSEFFPKTIEFIKELPFKEIGRILFFITHHYLHTDVHYDRKDNCFDGTNHFLWFNPFGQKKFFLIDDHKVQHYLTNRINFFDTSLLHGAAPANKMTYSLRIDGHLDESFCNSAGILWKAR
ncbi:MAG: hypothetical protein WA160_05565 [Pseudobdellovibrio sp.]